MSKQVRMACALLDLLIAERPLTASRAADCLEYDIDSIRQTLNVLASARWAEVSGLAPDGRTKLYIPGPKFREAVR